MHPRQLPATVSMASIACALVTFASATYKVESVIDLAAKRISRYDGECEFMPSGASQGVHCTLWKEEARLTVVREAVFSASGSWVFGR
jgi:hypothetical protein